MVSQALLPSLSPQVSVSAGTTAEAENHTAIPSSSARESRIKVRHLFIGVGGGMIIVFPLFLRFPVCV
jgi:hypothetical protein